MMNTEECNHDGIVINGRKGYNDIRTEWLTISVRGKNGKLARGFLYLPSLVESSHLEKRVKS